MADIEGRSGAAAGAASSDPEETQDHTAATEISPAPVGSTLGDYLGRMGVRLRGGDVGMLPVIGALVIVTVVFAFLSPNFLSPRNLVNLFLQSAVFIVLAMAEGFALLLGEIDLSVGYVAAIGGAVTAMLVQPSTDYFWLIAIGAGVAACAVIGLLQGAIITSLRLPSFVVTLAGYLIWYGVMLMLLGNSGTAPLSSTALNNQVMLHGIANANIPVPIGWAGLAVVVIGFGAFLFNRDAGRRRSGLVAPPVGVTFMKIGLVAVAGVAVVGLCSVDRGIFLPISGVPWAVPVVLVVVLAWTVLLEQTPFGRHIYAIGGNVEAARRAGIDVGRVKTIAFILVSATAALGGIIYASIQGGMTTNIQGGQLVLYAVAAAVIGGTSLFGGRGRALHGLLGGLVIGAIYNGMYLLGYPIQWQLVATGLVLIAAVTIDALSRRGGTASA